MKNAIRTLYGPMRPAKLTVVHIPMKFTWAKDSLQRLSICALKISPLARAPGFNCLRKPLLGFNGALKCK